MGKGFCGGIGRWTVLVLELERSRGGGDFEEAFVDVVIFDNEESPDLEGLCPVRPRAGDGVGEGVNGFVAFVVEVEGCTRVLEWELDDEVVLEDDVDADNTGGCGKGTTETVFGGGVGADRGSDWTCACG